MTLADLAELAQRVYDAGVFGAQVFTIVSVICLALVWATIDA